MHMSKNYMLSNLWNSWIIKCMSEEWHIELGSSTEAFCSFTKVKNIEIDIYSMILLGVTTHTRESY